MNSKTLLFLLITFGPLSVFVRAELTIPKLPWSPEEINQILADQWPLTPPNGPITQGRARLDYDELVNWRASYLEGGTNALLEQFHSFEKAVRQFSTEIEQRRNHRDPAQRPSQTTLTEWTAAYQEAVGIINGAGDYLGIYREWNRLYQSERRRLDRLR